MRAARLILWPSGIFVAAFVAATILSISPAAALDCGRDAGSPYNCYADSKDLAGSPWGGVQARWDIQDLYAPDWWRWYDQVNGIYGMAQQALWAGTGPGEWAEVGYTHGWKTNDMRTFFWAENIANWGYAEYEITWPPPGAFGTFYDFEVDHGWDTPEGRHIFKVYINGTCVSTREGVPCETNHAQWIQRHTVGTEATSRYAQIPPTHARNPLNRLYNSIWWNLWTPDSRYTDQPDGVSEWYGDYSKALYGQGIEYRDEFERSNPNDFPGWTLFEGGGDIFIHYDGDEDGVRRLSHVHAAYTNSQSYLLMRRTKADGYTGSPIVVEFGYGEDLATQAGRFFGVWSTGDSTQMGIGVHTGRCPNTYFYRWGPDPVNNWTCDTGVSRGAVDWHIFRFYIRPAPECSYGEIDGRAMTQKNCDLNPTNLNTYGIASAWGLVDQPAGYDGIWDNAVYFHR